MNTWLSDAIDYNHNVQLGGVNDDRLIYLYFSRYFNDFVTVSGTEERWLKGLGLQDKALTIPISNRSDQIVSTPEFAELAKTMPKRKFLIQKPIDAPYVTNPLTFVMNSPTIAHAYEHKRYFRDEFAELINIPEYEVHWLNDLNEDGHDHFVKLYGKYVIQDVESSGSKGTFIINNRQQYDQAIESLRATSFSGSVVVSRFEKGSPYSVQVCITRDGIFTGGLQRQLVDSKYLCNLDLVGTTRWCGGELGGDYPEIIKNRTQEIATVVGTELASHGYRGIFGIDLLITPEDDVFAIEINARMTGYTHILSDMQYAKHRIPFNLLHALELGNYRYEVNDLRALPSMNEARDKYSYLILNNQADGDFVFKKEIKPGLYKLSDNAVTYVKPALSIDEMGPGEILIFCKYKKGDVIHKGKRILKVLLAGGSMEGNDLDKATQAKMQLIKNTFGLPKQPMGQQ